MNELVVQIADALDAGHIPWRLPALPRNVASKNPYGGINPIMLQLVATKLNCSAAWWGTKGQWKMLDSQIIVADNEGVRLAQVEDLLYTSEQTDRSFAPPPLTFDDPKKVFEKIVNCGGVRVEYGTSSKCVYAGPPDDAIIIPHPFMFQCGPGGLEGYYDALGHELFHWSESRIGWNGTDVLKPLSLHLRRHHDHYAKRWARLIRSEPEILLEVCGNVTTTAAWLLRFAGKEVTWEES